MLACFSDTEGGHYAWHTDDNLVPTMRFYWFCTENCDIILKADDFLLRNDGFQVPSSEHRVLSFSIQVCTQTILTTILTIIITTP